MTDHLPKLILAVLLAAGCDSSSSSKKSVFSPYKSEELGEKVRDCNSLEPRNPYSSGSGHYAGFEWASNNSGATCAGNSTSFIEGCENFNSQEEVHSNCMHH